MIGSPCSQRFILGDLVECLSNSINVVRIKTGNRNSAITRHVNMVVILKHIDLLRAEACVSEHANLTGDMTPIVSASISFEFFNQSTSHFLDSSRHVQ